MLHRFFLLSAFLFQFPAIYSSQINGTTDSLIQQFMADLPEKGDLSDTVLLKNIEKITEKLWTFNADSSLWFSRYGISIARNLLTEYGSGEYTNYIYDRMGQITCNSGSSWKTKGNLPRAISEFSVALALFDSTGNKHGQMVAHNGLATTYWLQGLLDVTVDHFQKALRLSEEIGDKNGKAKILTNMGILYLRLRDYDRALEYYSKALKEVEGTRNDFEANILGNIGIVYAEKEQHTVALDFMFKALRINEKNNNQILLASTLNNIGSAYENLEKKDSALYYMNKAFELRKSINYKPGICTSYNNLGTFFYENGEYVKAKDYFLNGLTLAKELSLLPQQKDASLRLSDIFERQKDISKAYSYYKFYVLIRDSVDKEEQKNDVTKKEMKMQFDQIQAKIKAEQEKKDLEQGEKAKRERLILYALMVGLVIVLGFSWFIYRGYKEKKAANDIISTQKMLVDEKNKEITDSIQYAKRILGAQLPSEKYIENALKRLRKKVQD